MASGRKSPDRRFARVAKDPRFWEMPDRDRKVTIDRRFRSMFTDRRFQTTYTVDKRGRPVNQSSTEDLKRFYQLSDSEEEQEEQEEEEQEEGERPGGAERAVAPGGAVLEGDDEEEEEEQQSEAASSSEEEEEEEEDPEDEEQSSSDSDSDSGPDLARGKGNVETSSDEDEDEDEVDSILRREEEEIEHDWGELCKDAPRSEEVSARLAVCNMDWDRMKARDLLVLFNSFCPKGGAVLSVKIYTSQFGKERLQEEETQGPPELRAVPEDSEDDTEEERVHREKIRDYQFKRLKYFYGVLECDSVDTAARIYEECDGYEYESSCSVLDLRFVPDDVSFDEEPRDVALDANVAAYEPKLFTSSAAATSKVQLTWDETDHERVAALNRKFNKNELLDMDFKAYLASSSEEEEEQAEEKKKGEEEEEEESRAAHGEEEKKSAPTATKKKQKKSEEQISKYRELLKEVQKKEAQEDRDMEMEISWVPGLKEATERLVKKKMEASEQLTPWEEFLQKKKDKKKKKKMERKRADAGEDAPSEDEDEDLPPDVDLSDPFFAQELPPAGLKKKPKKRREEREEEEEQRAAQEDEDAQRHKAEMALLMEDDAAADARHKHFNYQKIVEQQNLSRKKKKKLQRKGEALPEDRFQVDVADSRFQALFTSPLFNLDPSHPSFKSTESTRSILAEKQRRRQEEGRPRPPGAAPAQPEAPAERTNRETDAGAPAAKRQKAADSSLSLLVKSIKSKTQQFHARKTASER